MHTSYWSQRMHYLNMFFKELVLKLPLSDPMLQPNLASRVQSADEPRSCIAAWLCCVLIFSERLLITNGYLIIKMHSLKMVSAHRVKESQIVFKELQIAL